MSLYALLCMFDLVVLDLVFICNGLVRIFVRFCVGLHHFGFVFCNFVLLGLVFSVPRLAGKNVSKMTCFMSSGT